MRPDLGLKDVPLILQIRRKWTRNTDSNLLIILPIGLKTWLQDAVHVLMESESLTSNYRQQICDGLIAPRSKLVQITSSSLPIFTLTFVVNVLEEDMFLHTLSQPFKHLPYRLFHNGHLQVTA